jgi:hypothetical protein
MNIRRFIIAGALILVGVVTTSVCDFNSQASVTTITNASLALVAFPGEDAGISDDDGKLYEIQLPPFEFRRSGAASPEDAAEAMFRACATRSPAHFVQHLLLGVCDGPIATLNKYAECLHSTRFRHGEDSLTFYDFAFNKRINPKKPFRAIATQDFDRESKEVAKLKFQMVSTYYGERFKSVDVAAESYDGLEYQTRIVVARVRNRWYAMPRCGSSKSFYEIADAMSLPSPEANEPG